MLSMFFAILGEAQAGVRSDQDEAKERAAAGDGDVMPEYGVFFYAGEYIKKMVQKVAWLRKRVGVKDFLEAVNDEMEKTDKPEVATWDSLMNGESELQEEVEKVIRQLGQLGQRVDGMSRQQKKQRQSQTEMTRGTFVPEGGGGGGGGCTDADAELELLVPKLTTSIVSQMGPRLTREIVAQIVSRKAKSSSPSKSKSHRFNSRGGSAPSGGTRVPSRQSAAAEPLRPAGWDTASGLEETSLELIDGKLIEGRLSTRSAHDHEMEC